jgi:hypothetical protein
MLRRDLVVRVRANTRDLTNSVFREADIVNYINEGIDRMKQLVRDLRGEIYLLDTNDVPVYIPEMYQHLLAVYATARCFAQDERNYQATTMMNEFEVKLGEFVTAVQTGDVIITTPEGEPLPNTYPVEYVNTDSYWGDSMSSMPTRNRDTDNDW